MAAQSRKAAGGPDGPVYRTPPHARAGLANDGCHGGRGSSDADRLTDQGRLRAAANKLIQYR
jgi:hypothetical protein